MFTGIIETLGEIETIQKQGKNIVFKIKSSILAPELKVDQSVAHNGVCLTVTEIERESYFVTAIDETLQKSNLGDWHIGTLVNLERSMMMNARLDGHIVQGHVDQVAFCKSVQEKDGSWEFGFEYEANQGNLTVEKGSITINGVSLTVVNAGINTFSVAIIPYTYENTNFKQLKENDKVNLEFDIIGKYVRKILENQNVLN